MTKSKLIKVNGQEYTVTFPNVGQFIDIQVLENRLSKGQTNGLIIGTGYQYDAYLYISTYAHFHVLCPELIEDLKVKTMFDLSFEDYEQLVQVYLKDIRPWIDEVRQGIKDKLEKQNEKQEK